MRGPRCAPIPQDVHNHSLWRHGIKAEAPTGTDGEVRLRTAPSDRARGEGTLSRCGGPRRDPQCKTPACRPAGSACLTTCRHWPGIVQPMQEAPDRTAGYYARFGGGKRKGSS